MFRTKLINKENKKNIMNMTTLNRQNTPLEI